MALGGQVILTEAAILFARYGDRVGWMSYASWLESTRRLSQTAAESLREITYPKHEALWVLIQVSHTDSKKLLIRRWFNDLNLDFNDLTPIPENFCRVKEILSHFR